MDLKDWYDLGSIITQENVSRKLQPVILQEKIPSRFKEYKWLTENVLYLLYLVPME
jgi:hypothetical protein